MVQGHNKPLLTSSQTKPSQMKAIQTKPSLMKPSEIQSKDNCSTSCQLHITFHNPNTTEVTAKYLAKAIAKNLLDLASIRRQSMKDNKKI